MSQKNNETFFDDDDILFAEETPDKVTVTDGETWKLMIVDDEEEIHDITRLALEDFTFEDRELTYLSAYSGEEAKKLIRENSDTSVILLDVVMETEHSGLDVVEYIRKELKNSFVRIILRTGHPGQAPERKVITEYDINDYKQKTELTAKKLFSSVTTAIRSYRDLKTIEKNRQGLEEIIEASANIFKPQSFRMFTAGVLTWLTSILHPDDDLLRSRISAFVATQEKGEFIIISAIGSFSEHVRTPVLKAVPKAVARDLTCAIEQKQSVFSDNAYTGYFSSSIGSDNLIYLESPHNLDELDKRLIQIFAHNVIIALDNIYLNQEIVDTQKEVITTLGEVVENRSKETANHVLRVAEMSRVLALKAGIDEEEAEILRLAAPMHDVGKIGIPDSVLLKPGRLTSEEFELIKTHTLIGYNILKNSNRRIMKTAAFIALQHHERCDGNGYPQGLKKDDIHVFVRIVEIIDVFDALFHDRIYKKAWELDRILALFKEERGKHFDAHLVDLFLENLDEFLAINDAYPDDR
ncbi:Two component system response regulator, DUF3369 [Desulfonema magnum]|uniref:Two component system response regulator, DUF3369 n=2 Tax=Desulfonema magnum TaxID=45655 RepID=A0A975GMP6_9BACT|nr:Two component system response regulator, DUF3369 [Desulfonema magnum]